jgi:hypothetical protein
MVKSISCLYTVEIIDVVFGSIHHGPQWTGCCKNVKGEDPLATRNDIYTFQVNKAIMDIVLWQYVVREVESLCLWCALYQSPNTGLDMVMSPFHVLHWRYIEPCHVSTRRVDLGLE